MPKIDSPTLHDQIADANKKLNDKAYQIKREQFNAEEAQTRAMKQRLRQAKDMDTLDGIINKIKQVDKDGLTEWDRFGNDSNRLLNSQQNNTMQWQSHMADLLAILSDLVPLLQKSLKASIASIPKKELNPFVLKNALKEFVYSTKDKIVDKLRGDPRINIPTLVHDVSMNENNQIQIGGFKTASKGEDFNLVNADNKEIDSLKDEFDTVVKLWLNTNHYIKMNDGTYVNYDTNSPDYNQVLTKQKFEELKNNPEHGLDHFLETNSELKFSPGAKP
ncbi:MAG: hypothetical protein BGO90_03695 [Legionella sp. 40-6]|nr:hypothetical protein [Legionella sp.]OJY54793.1 MAG: hypothetical protein BGO90_03695 [Legionella sp. 40-6]